MIQVLNLFKSFGRVKAVDNLSFEIQKGEIIGFLGPNGAGKTTTLRLLSGFLFPDQGSIKIAGISVLENTEQAQKHIGYLAENNPLYKDMLVSEILNLSADLKNLSKAQKLESLDFAVNSCAISDVFYKSVSELSKGYKQRVGIATALLGQPDIIIMDEPTEGLDPNQREEIRQLIKSLAKNMEQTIIMSTHVMAEVQAVASRILIINQGKLAADGTPDELALSAQAKKIIILNIQGNNLEPVLRDLAREYKAKLNIESKNLDFFKAKILLKNSQEIRPEISKLAHKYNWTIWELREQEKKLEDVFRKLTRKK
ncbi:hypothetical protein CL633_03020 [bacterium]|nr:hypothetical protein [bacterium]|tara:strand:+ start:10263 stop:11201 length:939 start_codon:yes stop_codon:yes gene_type:complete